ncbi:hypothetical protein GCM10009623_34570 [Nocardioides aestuarii]
MYEWSALAELVLEWLGRPGPLEARIYRLIFVAMVVAVVRSWLRRRTSQTKEGSEKPVRARSWLRRGTADDL